MVRYLVNESDEERQAFREEVLSTTVADFNAFAEVLERVNESGLVVAMGSQEAIEQANEAGRDRLDLLKVL